MIVSLNVVFAISVIVLTASGLAVVFGLMGVINFAHGDFIMLGAFLAVLLDGEVPFPLLVLLAAAGVAIYAIPVERFLIRRFYGSPLDTILVTFGLGLMTRELIRALVGGEEHAVADPLTGGLSIGGLSYPYYRFVVIACAIVLLIALAVVVRRTLLGASVRAVIENPRLASSQGLNVGRTYALSFAVGAALAGLAGALLSPIISVNPDMGFGFVIEGFLVVLIGGPGSVLGFAAASTVLAASDSLALRYLDPALASLSVLLVAVILLRARPRGLSVG